MVKVYTSSVINAAADRVWSVIRDFNAMPKWHPGIAESRIEGNDPADKVGCIRNFTVKDGGRIRERLLALSDFDYSCTYVNTISWRTPTTPLPVELSPRALFERLFGEGGSVELEHLLAAVRRVADQRSGLQVHDEV